jgi:hypothetical protein
MSDIMKQDMERFAARQQAAAAASGSSNSSSRSSQQQVRGPTAAAACRTCDAEQRKGACGHTSDDVVCAGSAAVAG